MQAPSPLVNETIGSAPTWMVRVHLCFRARNNPAQITHVVRVNGETAVAASGETLNSLLILTTDVKQVRDTCV